MNYLQLVRNYAPYLGYGFTHYFFSCIGQTFLISVFVASFTTSLGIKNEGFAIIYAAATLAGAFLLPFLGNVLDNVTIRKFSLVNGLSQAFFCFLIGYAQNRYFLFFCILGLRLTGQSLMPLIASTSIGRYFTENRGKSLSLSSLGLSLSETIMPAVAMFFIATTGWENAWRILGLMVLLIFIPLVLLLVKKDDKFQVVLPVKPGEPGLSGKTRKEVIRDRDFYTLISTAVFVPFIITGLFIHHNLLADLKGWSMEWIATCFIFYGLAKITTTFIAGPLIDSLSARVVFPFHLVPMILGVLALLAGNHKLYALVYLALAGVCTSLASVSSTAMWVEIYGFKNLGSIKSMTTTVMVFVSATAPVLLGFFLAKSEWWQYALWACIILMILLMLRSFLVLKNKPIYTSS
ncbi:MAG: MFS transporter [Cyclobacteriaceae bacterium]